MQCPATSFDCITCEEKCLLVERRRHADPFRRGNELRTCDDEVRQIGMEKVQAGDAIKDETPCTPGWCGEGHGAKCFNAGRCLREATRKAAARKATRPIRRVK